MNKVAILLLGLPLLFGCPDSGESLPDSGDAGGGVDVRVITVPDAGPMDANEAIPTITRVAPATGPETGGSRVTIRGSSFTEPATVRFGDAEATSVVVLDEVSIAATTPPNMIGAVTVTVETSGGVAELPEGYVYHRELRLDAVEPARVPDEGGVFVAVLGKGFDDHTIVLFDRSPLRGHTLVSETRIEGYIPALEPGRPEVRVLTREAQVRRTDVLIAFGTPEIDMVLPGYGPTTGGMSQDIAGDGLKDAERAQFGDDFSRAIDVGNDMRLTAEAPALAEGVHDVTVANADTSGTRPGGYVAYDPLNSTLAVLGVLPAAVDEGSGTIITVVGRGFDATSQVALDGVRMAIIDRNANALTLMVPTTLAAGRVDVEVDTGPSSATLAGGLFIRPVITLDSVTPSSGPASGGTQVRISGVGLSGTTEIRIADVPLDELTILSDTEVIGRTVAGAHGVHDVVLRIDGRRVVLENGFRFEEPFEVIQVEPNEGSIAGNAYVSVIGRGFDLPVDVGFNGVPGLVPLLENGSVIGVRTQPSPTGPADVSVNAAEESDLLPGAFRFYNPTLLTGGAWGGPIEGSVNVAVQTFNRDPVPGAVVQLGHEGDLRYAGVTDENGLATISSPEIRGAYTVTAGRPGVEFVTFQEVNARNLTMFASPYPQPMPPDAPVPPCPANAELPIIRGQLFKFKSSLDPVTRPGWIAVARITYSQPNVFSANPPMPPEQVDFVFEEGGAYEIQTTRVGTVAVYATLGDFNPDTQAFIPRKMGIARSVPAAVATVTDGINISLDINLDQSVAIRLDQPPQHVPGPTINAVFPFLNLASDGVIAFPATAIFGDNTVVLPNLPDLAESAFYYMGGSFTTDGMGALFSPYSLSFIESASAFEDGLDLGPFLQMPQNVSPKAGELIEDGVISWDLAGITPDITTITIGDFFGVSARCFLDMNMNGMQDPGEMLVESEATVPSNRWSLFAQGGQSSYALPQMPSGINAFNTPSTAFWTAQQAIAPRFNYNEFIYNQFSPFFWSSWTVSGGQFTVKEETD